MINVPHLQASTINGKTVAASWCERGIVYLWDLATPLDVVEDSKTLANYIKNNKSLSPEPILTFNGHGVEGFAMDWSQINKGITYIVIYTYVLYCDPSKY